VISPLNRVIREFNSKDCATEEHRAAIRGIPWMCQRNQSQPDIAYIVPGEGEDQRARLIGQLKTPWHCKMNEDFMKPESIKQGSLENLFSKHICIQAV
jgi:hypothetical protein